MANEKSVSRNNPGAWPVLLLVPAVVAVALLIPQLGEQEQGVLAEVLGSQVAYTEDFYPFALETRRWGALLFAVACLIGVIFWLVTSRIWRARLSRFDAEAVMSYRPMVLEHTFLAMLTAATLTASLVLLTTEMRAMSVVNWAVLMISCGLLAALQHFVTVFGITNTRRLYRGR